jgi:hypothetical protein
MPTARELLEQADALMRRNRAPAPPAESVAAELPAIPELTEVAAADAIAAAQEGATTAAPGDTAPGDTELESAPAREALARELPEGAMRADVYEARAAVDLALDDIPELTEAIEEIEAPSILDPGGDFEFGEPSVFLGAEHGEAGLFGPWPPPDGLPGSAPDGDDGDAPPAAGADAGVLYVEPELLDEALLQQLPADALAAAVGDAPAAAPAPIVDAIAVPTAALSPPAPYVLLLRPAGPELAAPRAAPATIASAVVSAPGIVVAAAVAPTGFALPLTAPDPAADAARWATLAEEIRMQVLQRIDIFTDTGLQEQLTLRLQPIVDRASADLVATINQHLGQLLRAYVAEAIEREIEKWRASDR